MSTLEYLRNFRILDYALFDLALAILGMWLLSPILSRLFTKVNIYIPKRSWIIWAIPIGFLFHLLLGIQTLMTVRLLDPSGHYLLKAGVILLVLLGFIGVRVVKNKK